MKKGFKIIFMGTPEFAVPALRALVESRHRVAGVVTQPDRPCGRGCRIMPPAVKTAALACGLEVLQPDSVRTGALADSLRKQAPDLFVVVAFGHILPKSLLTVPKQGTINIHASLLPRYRGPAPIQWALIKGEKKTGVTTMYMDEGLDTGDILLSAETAISPEDCAATLHDRLAVLGADLLMDTLAAFEKGSVRKTPQAHHLSSYAPLLRKQDGHILWEKPAAQIAALIRGVTPWPGAFTFCGRKRLKIFKAQPNPDTVTQPPGTVLKGFSDELRVAAGEGSLSILEIQGASGKRLPIDAFLRGAAMPPGTIFE